MFTVFIAMIAFLVVSCVLGVFVWCYDNKCAQITYLISLLLVFVIKTVDVFMIDKFDDIITVFLEEYFYDEAIKLIIKSLKKELKCCGWT